MSFLDTIPLDPGEAKLDTWTLLYYPPMGGKYNGKLLVTNQRLIYDAKYDATVAGQLANMHSIKLSSEGHLIIPKARIANVEVQKSFFAKKVILTLDDGQKHTFSYGMMNIDPVAAAIQQR